MPYPFFLSYARNDDWQRADPYMATFLEQLNKRVRYLTGAKQDGFRDASDIKPGQEWRDELIEALCTAPTMICQYSPSYFASDACGKEMEVFLERRRAYMKQNAGKKPANIIPVWWQPVKRLPRAIPDFQYDPPAGLNPKDNGIWTLLDKGKESEFREIVNKVALRVRDATDDTPLPRPGFVPIFGGVRNAFEPPLPLEDFDVEGASAGPECVTFVYANDPAWDSWPYAPPVQQAVLHVSASIAAGRDYAAHCLAFDAKQSDLIPRLHRARERNNVVVTFVNANGLKVDSVRQRLREYDAERFETFSTMVVWPTAGAVDKQLVQQTFPFLSSRQPPFFHPSIQTAEQLDQAVFGTLDALKMAVLRQPQNPNPMPQSSEFGTLPTTGGAGQMSTN